MVLVVVNLVSQPYFFVKVTVSFAINKAVLIGKKIAIGFFGLFL